MPGRGIDYFTIPGPFWQFPETVAALRNRDIRKLLVLIAQHTRASQTQLATACGMTQPKINAIMRGTQQVQTLVVFERFADAFGMPDPARIHLGLAPRAPSPPVRPKQPVARMPDLARPAQHGGDVIAAAASEAFSDRLTLVTEPTPESLEWLWQESQQIARVANRPPLETFVSARQLRCQALELANRTRRPGVLLDLYAICGQATALMASGAFDLNRWDESATLAKSAITYAELAGHASLQAWTFGLAALLANWRREPDRALSQYQQGMKIAPRGTPRYRLRHIASRSYALLGDGTSVADILMQARQDQNEAHTHPDRLSSAVGGEFAFGQARAQACAAAAWLDLKNGREALDAAQAALTALTSLPEPRRSASQVNGARIDMATACLLSDDLNGGTEAIRPVLAAPASLRNVSLTGRLTRTRTTLLSQHWARNSQARQLADQIGQLLP